MTSSIRNGAGFAALLALALAGCNKKTDAAPEKTGAVDADAPVAVSLVPSREVKAPRFVALSGTLIGSAEAQARKTRTAGALRDTEIGAPFSGMVVERAVTAGEYVQPASRVATLVDTDSLRV